MSAERKAYADRLRFRDDKKRTVVGEMLARKAIAERCRVSAETIVFCRTKHGKPYAKDLQIEFSVSHSGHNVVCAISDAPIGIDVEEIRPIDLCVARRICTDNELVYLFGHYPTEMDFVKEGNREVLTRLFELWTMKEAYFKCEGTGITDMRSVDLYHVREEKQYFSTVNGNYVVSICETKMR